MTLGHQQLVSLVTQMGFQVRIEEPFAPYVVDVYIPEMHVALEADGPRHSKRKDALRDAVLLEQYGLPVLRFANKELGRGMVTGGYKRPLDRIVPLPRLVEEFMEQHGKNIEERRALMPVPLA